MDAGSIIGIFIILIIGFIFFIPSGIFSSVLSELEGLCNGCLNCQLPWIDDLVSEIENGFIDIGNDIANTATNAGNSIANTATNAGDSIANTATNAGNSIAHAFGF